MDQEMAKTLFRIRRLEAEVVDLRRDLTSALQAIRLQAGRIEALMSKVSQLEFKVPVK